MTTEQKAAYINAKAASMIVEMNGMVAENLQRFHRNESLAYDYDAFTTLLDKYQLGENTLIEFCFRE